MKKDVQKIVVFELMLLVVLFFTLFVSNMYVNLIMALILSIFAIATKYIAKKKNILSIYKNQVTLLMGGFAAIYILVFYIMGFYFGFYKATVPFSLTGILFYIIPLTIVIIASEYIRSKLISQKGKFTKVATFISMVLIDLIIYTRVYDLNNLDDFLAAIGFVLFASISCNLLYNYTSNRYGDKPVIIYRLITVLYTYIIPITPNVYIFFRSFLRMLYPYIMYVILENAYSKSNFAVAYKDKKKSILSTAILVTIMATVTMLISCQFRFGILVIGSESMTGAINKGDAVVFEQYKNQKLDEQQVIIFEQDNILVVHRIVRIKNVNGEYHYFTKGDANQKEDESYITSKDIVGVTKLRIQYIGYPSLWIRDIFS